MNTTDWISVDERLPEVGQFVLIYDETDEAWWFTKIEDDDLLDFTEYQTHWMLCPEPPAR